MKSLDERLSAIISPYDETGMSQEDLLEEQHTVYQQEAIIESIGSRQFKIEFDLHFNEVIDKLTEEEKILFITKCFDKLCYKFSMDVLQDYIKRNGNIDRDSDSIIQLLEYFAHDKWVELGQYLPKILDQNLMNSINNLYIIQDLFTAHFSDIKNKIKEGVTNQYIQWYFDNTSTYNGVKTLMYMASIDFPGLVSVQLLYIK